MPDILVAIAIPAYNAETTIGDSLDALQSNPALARITLVALLDDCSKDRTVEVARAHWRSPVPLEVWRNPENMGERRTTNAAIARLAQQVGWTFILHADDVVKPNWLSLYLDELPRIPVSVATICSSYDNWWPDTGRCEPGEDLPGEPARHIPGERIHVLGTLEKGCWWHISGCGLRNAAFLAIGGFKPDMPQLGDWEWLLRCLAKGYDVWYLPRTTMLYRQHAGSISSRSFREARDVRERLRILSTMRDQGWLTDATLRKHVGSLLRGLTKRTMARLVRGDLPGFQAHSALLASTALRSLRHRR